VDDTGCKKLLMMHDEMSSSELRVTKLNLSGNLIAVSGAKRLCKLLEKNTTILNLRMYDNELGDTGIDKLSTAFKTNSTLVELNLYSNNIGSAGIRSFLTNLQHNKYLTSLDIGWNNLGEEGAKAMAPLLNKSQVEILNLGNTKLGEIGLGALIDARAFHKIVSLNLEHNTINSPKILANLLDSCKFLKYLNLTSI